jgi:hypothetical protein
MTPRAQRTRDCQEDTQRHANSARESRVAGRQSRVRIDGNWARDTDLRTGSFSCDPDSLTARVEEVMRETLQDALAAVRNELARQDAFQYLPEILEAMERMVEVQRAGRGDQQEVLRRLFAGLGRLVTEDMSFAGSELGGRILAAGKRCLREKQPPPRA